MKKILRYIRSLVIAPDPTDAMYNTPDVQDFLKLAWDMREDILNSTTEGELEMFRWDIEWLEEEFQQRVPRFILDQHLDSLTAMRMAKLRPYINF
jgi:hypothetical protein